MKRYFFVIVAIVSRGLEASASFSCGGWGGGGGPAVAALAAGGPATPRQPRCLPCPTGPPACSGRAR